MAKLIPGTFTSYEFSDSELLSASILSVPQKQLLQSELSQIADNRLNLDFDPSCPAKFTQHEAYLKGQMSIIRVMLLRSDESEMQLQSRHQNPLGE